jgi:hypothetical protein
MVNATKMATAIAVAISQYCQSFIGPPMPNVLSSTVILVARRHRPIGPTHRRATDLRKRVNKKSSHRKPQRLSGFEPLLKQLRRPTIACACLDDEGKRAYAQSLHRATRDGATLLLSGFSDANAADIEWPLPDPPAW